MKQIPSNKAALRGTPFVAEKAHSKRARVSIGRALPEIVPGIVIIAVNYSQGPTGVDMKLNEDDNQNGGSNDFPE